MSIRKQVVVCNRSSGFGLSLVAESTKGVLLSTESSSRPTQEGNVISPDDLGRQTAVSLLEEIYRVGKRISENEDGCRTK